MKAAIFYETGGPEKIQIANVPRSQVGPDRSIRADGQSTDTQVNTNRFVGHHSRNVISKSQSRDLAYYDYLFVICLDG